MKVVLYDSVKNLDFSMIFSPLRLWYFRHFFWHLDIFVIVKSTPMYQKSWFSENDLSLPEGVWEIFLKKLFLTSMDYKNFLWTGFGCRPEKSTTPIIDVRFHKHLHGIKFWFKGFVVILLFRIVCSIMPYLYA